MLQIKDIDIRYTVEEDQKSASLEVVLRADAEGTAFLCAQLLAPDGGEADRILPVPVEERMDFCMQVSPVGLWDTESAKLYELVLELRDEKMQLLGTTARKVAFCRWEEKDGVRLLNGKQPRRRAVSAPDGFWKYTEEQLRSYLAKTRLAGYNTILARDARAGEKEELCREYGICLEEGAGAPEREDAADADFELSVMQQGVLIENRCVYTNASEYDLIYELLRGGRVIYRGRACADVPPGGERYVDLPYPQPKEAGEYLYRAALCLKRDAAWAKKGFEIAVGETVLSNAFRMEAG